MAAAPDAKVLRFAATGSTGEVSALLLQPATANRLLVFAHGAGADMRHAFMEATAKRLATRGIATFRYQFPFMEGKRRWTNSVIRVARCQIASSS